MKIKFYLLFIGLFNERIYSKDQTPSDFFSLCKSTHPVLESKEKLCTKFQQKYFSLNKNKDIVLVKPENLGATPALIDKKIQYIMFNDPNYAAGIAYCYFTFRHWLDSKLVSPDQFGMNVSGFSILNEDLSAYQEWLVKDPSGKSCKNLVSTMSEAPVVDLKSSLKNYTAIIGINPYALLNGIKPPSYESMNLEMKLTVEHERIHAYQVECPEFEAYSIKEWQNLIASKKNEFIKKYNFYNWNDPKIAGREYMAYSYEDFPSQVLSLVKNCKFK